MADKLTTLDLGSGGNVVIGEDIGGRVLPVSKIRNGANGTDGGDITPTNPLDVALSDGTDRLGTVAHPVQTADAATLAKAEAIRALIAALLPSALVGGRLDVNVGAVTPYTQPIQSTFLDEYISTRASEVTLESGFAQLVALLSGVLDVALPTGASTATKQDTGNTSLAAILSGLSSLATATAQATAQTSLSAIVSALGPLATQTTVAAILSALQGTLTVGLPSGAATSTAQGTGNASLASIDGKVTACNTGAVVVSTCALPTGAATSAAQATGNASLSSLDGKVTACNTGAVTVTTCALPSGASTSAAQTTAQTSLSAIATSVATDATNTTAIATSTATTATQSTTTATNTGTTATTLSSILTKFTDALARFGVLGIDGATLASASNPVPTAEQPWSVATIRTGGSLAISADVSIKGSAGYIRSFQVTNNSGGPLVFGLFDKASALASNDYPIVPVASLANGATASVDYGPGGVACGTGIRFGAWATGILQYTTGTTIAADKVSATVRWK